MAAGRKVERDARRQPLDRNRFALLRHDRCNITAARPRHQRFHHLRISELLPRHCFHQSVLVWQFEPFQRCCHRPAAQLGGQARDDFVIDFAAQRDIFAKLLITDKAADCRPRFARRDKVQPRRLRLLCL